MIQKILSNLFPRNLLEFEETRYRLARLGEILRKDASAASGSHSEGSNRSHTSILESIRQYKEERS